MKHEYTKLKFHIQKVKKLQNRMKPVNIFAGVIANGRNLGLENVALVLEVMFVITPLRCTCGVLFFFYESN